jgi:flagellar hook-associated protein 1 FlgK
MPVLGSVESLDLDRTSAERIEALRASLGNAITTYTSSTATTLASWANEVRANEKLLSSLTTQKESLSGVSLDEEAANLIKYQQVYNASSKVLQVSKQLFDTLLAMLSTT